MTTMPHSAALARQAMPPRRPTAAHALCRALAALGVDCAFGLVGGAIAPLSEALAAAGLAVYHCRHEGGAGFSAVEASLATRKPVVLFATTGPGLTNALTGLSAAKWEGAHVLLLSGSTSAAQRGRWACQETSALTLPLSGLFTSGPIFDFATTVEHPAQLGHALMRLAEGFSRPQGFVAHLSLPLAAQTGALAELPLAPFRRRSPGGEAMVREVAALLQRAPAVIWAGWGARAAAPELRRLAERLRAPVMCTPRAKGVFPESHPLYLGTTGLGGQEQVEPFLRANRPAFTLVLGSRLSEPSSFWSEALTPAQSFIHVDLDASVLGAAYPGVPVLAVEADTRDFLDALLDEVRGAPPAPLAAPGPQRPPAVAVREGGPVRPPVLLAELQRLVVEGSDAPVMTESGNAFAWGNNLLRFEQPGRYRVSTGFGSMGHAAAGVVGLALARQGKAVALVGDGSMLMSSEVSTAVQYRAQAVWVVMNDARYNMVEQGMSALGFTPVETRVPRTDFVALARAVGADGAHVGSERELAAALAQALGADGPFVVDVDVDAEVPAPWMKRIQNLILQGADASKGKP